MPLSPEQLDKLRVWNDAKSIAAHHAAIESTLRDQLVKELFSNKEVGSETIEIDNGWTLKATKKLDYKLDNSEGQTVALCAILVDDLASKLIKWKPEISVSTYKELDATTQVLFNGCLTIKPAKPTLELIPPKVEEKG